MVPVMKRNSQPFSSDKSPTKHSSQWCHTVTDLSRVVTLLGVQLGRSSVKRETCPSGLTRLPALMSAAVQPSLASRAARAASLAGAPLGSSGLFVCSSSISLAESSTSDAMLLPRGDLHGDAPLIDGRGW